MKERQILLESIASTTADYWDGDLLSTDHLDKWVHQFTGDVRLPLLRELDHVLKQTYFSRRDVTSFLEKLITTNKLAGPSPCDFWTKAQFLKIQQNGHSQEELLAIFDDVLLSKCGLMGAQTEETGGDFIYLDDVIFSGNRVGNDLARWIDEDAPIQATIHIIVIAFHMLGQWQVKKRLADRATSLGKKININFWRMVTIENRKQYRRDSEVLWPATLPDDPDLEAYLELPHKYPFLARPPGGNLGPYSSEQGRQLLEHELLIAGVKIRTACKNPKDIMRPLGFSPFGLGFGSMIVTFRNCPNNCPLALWWGDPDADPDHPFSKWYPLFPRKTYSTEVSLDDLFF